MRTDRLERGAGGQDVLGGPRARPLPPGPGDGTVDVADLNSAAPKGRVGSNPTPGTWVHSVHHRCFEVVHPKHANTRQAQTNGHNIRHRGLPRPAMWYFTDSSEASPPNQGFHPTKPTFPRRATCSPTRASIGATWRYCLLVTPPGSFPATQIPQNALSQLIYLVGVAKKAKNGEVQRRWESLI